MSQDKNAAPKVTPNDPKLFGKMLGLMLRHAKEYGQGFQVVEVPASERENAIKQGRPLSAYWQKPLEENARPDNRTALAHLEPMDSGDGKSEVVIDLLSEGQTRQFNEIGSLCLMSPGGANQTIYTLNQDGTIFRQVGRGIGYDEDERWEPTVQVDDEELSQVVRQLSDLQPTSIN